MKNTTSTRSRSFHFTSEEKFVFFIVIAVVIGLLIRCYGNHLIEKTTEEVTIEVAEQVIESAKLEEIRIDGYTISFDGESHNYNW